MSVNFVMEKVFDAPREKGKIMKGMFKKQMETDFEALAQYLARN